MIAFKGVTKNMESRLGNKTIKFELGKTYKEESSKTVRSGFHCCENPIECLTYYSLGTDRFFVVKAGGDIDEDDQERISCTEITFLKELDIFSFAYQCMCYIINHPKRDWVKDTRSVKVSRDRASAEYIAIAIGEQPMARVTSPDGVIGLIVEENGEFTGATFKRVSEKVHRGVYYTISEKGVREATDEEKNDRED